MVLPPSIYKEVIFLRLPVLCQNPQITTLSLFIKYCYMYVICAYLYVRVKVHTAHRWVWRSEDIFKCWSLPPTMFETQVLIRRCCVHQATWHIVLLRLLSLPFIHCRSRGLTNALPHLGFKHGSCTPNSDAQTCMAIMLDTCL